MAWHWPSIREADKQFSIEHFQKSHLFSSSLFIYLDRRETWGINDDDDDDDRYWQANPGRQAVSVRVPGTTFHFYGGFRFPEAMKTAKRVSQTAHTQHTHTGTGTGTEMRWHLITVIIWPSLDLLLPPIGSKNTLDRWCTPVGWMLGGESSGLYCVYLPFIFASDG